MIHFQKNISSFYYLQKGEDEDENIFKEESVEASTNLGLIKNI